MKYMAQVMVQVELDAPGESEARGAIEDCLHIEDCGGFSVVDLEVLDIDELG